MAEAVKLLGRANPPADILETNATTIYTVPSGASPKQAALDLIVVCSNVGPLNSLLKLIVAKNGAAYSHQQLISWMFPFPMGSSELKIPGIVLGAGDVLKAATSTSRFGIQAWGVESDPAGGGILAQGQFNLPTAWVDMYTCPPDKRAILTLVNVCNTSPSKATINLGVSPGGVAPANGHIIWWDVILHGYGVLQERNILMGPGDVLRASTSLSGQKLQVFGFEVPA